MGKEQLAIKATFKDLPTEKFLFEDFYFLDVDEENGRFIPTNEKQTKKYWELKHKIYEELTGHKAGHE